MAELVKVSGVGLSGLSDPCIVYGCLVHEFHDHCKLL